MPEHKNPPPQGNKPSKSIFEDEPELLEPELDEGEDNVITQRNPRMGEPRQPQNGNSPRKR